MTRLIEIIRPEDPIQLRRAFWANAISLDGLQAADMAQRTTWLEILGPVEGRWDLDRPFKVWRAQDGSWRTEGLSTCGLVAEGIWRRMRVDLQALYQPYVNGSAIERARVFAQKLKPTAWVTPGGNKHPSMGDYLVIGTGLRTHACTVLRHQQNILVSVDGGGVGDNNLQSVSARSRIWLTAAKGARVRGRDTRNVVAWIDVTKLPYRGETCLVPAGWED